MKAKWIAGLVATIAVASSAMAEPIEVGHHVLLPNLAGQPVDILVNSLQGVEGLNFNAEVGPGGPAIQDVILFDGAGGEEYIFDASNTGTTDLDGVHPDHAPLWECRSTTTASGTVVASGLLATILFDTTGLTGGGPWTLKLSSTRNGPTDFAGVELAILDGTVTIDQETGVPEPSSLSLLALGAVAARWCVRRRKRRLQ